jgi:predicted nuclease of predicted toxin-antitoxin system
MKFLLDAQLPRRLAVRLQAAGHDAIHTFDLPSGNRTPDNVINEISLDQQRVVVTKDADFVNSFIVSRQPYKLLLISTGNIKNDELNSLLLDNIERIIEAFTAHDFVEISRSSFIAHI